MASLNYTPANVQVAETILSQLGGKRFVLMTGANKLTVIANGLRFAIGRNAKQINQVAVTLDGSDLYTVTFSKVSLSKKTWEVTTKQIAEARGVYAEDLRDIFTANTGLFTSLF